MMVILKTSFRHLTCSIICLLCCFMLNFFKVSGVRCSLFYANPYTLKVSGSDYLCMFQKCDMVPDLFHICRENYLSFWSTRSGQNKYWSFNSACLEP